MCNYYPEVMLQNFLTNEVYCTIGELSLVWILGEKRHAIPVSCIAFKTCKQKRPRNETRVIPTILEISYPCRRIFLGSFRWSMSGLTSAVTYRTLHFLLPHMHFKLILNESASVYCQYNSKRFSFWWSSVESTHIDALSPEFIMLIARLPGFCHFVAAFRL